MDNFSRRDLFLNLFGVKQNNASIQSTGLEENLEPLTEIQVRHLLRRTTFGVNQDFVNKFTGKTAAAAVETLFQNADAKINPQVPYFFGWQINNPALKSGEEQKNAQTVLDEHAYKFNNELGGWWVNLMQQDTHSILEKMTLFWHGHLVSQYNSCVRIVADSMYIQNTLFRKNYAGNFQEILEKVTIDGAMLLYLNGNENYSDSPNENYARELLELFTLGIGNYTEQDIKEAAKILTGWRMSVFVEDGSPFIAQLVPSKFDPNSKMFMGQVFDVNYEINQENVLNNSVKKLINTIITIKAKETASFMSEKLYRYFVYANGAKEDSATIKALADELLANKFEFRPSLKKLLKSKHFYDDLNIGVQIKAPTDTFISFTREFPFDQKSIRNIMGFLGQELFNPPNVSGWKGYRNWVTTKSLPATINILQIILVESNDDYLGNWIKKFPNYSNPSQLVDNICNYFIARPLTSDRITKLTNVLLSNAPEYEWGSILANNAIAGAKVRALINEIIKAPDFYLY